MEELEDNEGNKKDEDVATKAVIRNDKGELLRVEVIKCNGHAVSQENIEAEKKAITHIRTLVKGLIGGIVVIIVAAIANVAIPWERASAMQQSVSTLQKETSDNMTGFKKEISDTYVTYKDLQGMKEQMDLKLKNIEDKIDTLNKNLSQHMNMQVKDSGAIDKSSEVVKN